MRKGRPRKEISKTMSLVEDTEATVMWLVEYTRLNLDQHKRPIDEKALEKLQKMLERWWKLRATEFQQGLLYEEEDGQVAGDT